MTDALIHAARDKLMFLAYIQTDRPVGPKNSVGSVKEPKSNRWIAAQIEQESDP